MDNVATVLAFVSAVHTNTTILALFQNDILLLYQLMSLVLNCMQLLLPCIMPLIPGTVSEPALLCLHTRSLIAKCSDSVSYGC